MNIQVDSKIEMRKINTIKPYVRNPRRNTKTVELLTKIIPRVGFNVPIVVDERGIIVKGHARFAAAIRLGMEEVPVIVSHADEEAIKADRITDNKISEFSEWITEDLMQEINSMDFDLSELGLPKLELDTVPTVHSVAEEITTPQISEEKRQEIFREFEEEQRKQYEEDKDSALDEPYYKCVCDKCGYVMFFREGEI